MLLLSIIDAVVDVIIDLRYFVCFVFFSESFLLDLIVACTMSKSTSNLLSILLPCFGILKLEVRIAGSQK